MQTYGVVLGRVLVSLQDLDPVPLAKPLDLPHRQVSEFLFKVEKKKNNNQILLTKETNSQVFSHLVAFSPQSEFRPMTDGSEFSKKQQECEQIENCVQIGTEVDQKHK